MAEIVITPTGTGDIEVGGFHDETGKRFIGVSFAMTNGDHTIVTMTLPFYEAFTQHLADASAQFAREDYWQGVAKG